MHVPLSVFSLVLATVFGPSAYEIYYLWYATSKYCLQTNIPYAINFKLVLFKCFPLDTTHLNII